MLIVRSPETARSDRFQYLAWMFGTFSVCAAVGLLVGKPDGPAFLWLAGLIGGGLAKVVTWVALEVMLAVGVWGLWVWSNDRR